MQIDDDSCSSTMELDLHKVFFASASIQKQAAKYDAAVS